MGRRVTEESRGVLITGGSRGIGAAVARRFAADGDRVAFGYRSDHDAANQTLEQLNGDGHVALAANIADPEEIPGMVAGAIGALGRIDVLVNNAALYSTSDPHRRLGHPIDAVGYKEWVDAWRLTLDVNLLGAAHVTHQVVRHMLDSDPKDELPRGRIINIGSRGAYRGEPDVPAYGAAKAGLHAMGQSLAVALAPHGVSVTSVAPGFVETDMTSALLSGDSGATIRAQSPFGRVAQPGEIAALVHHLASQDSEWVSGAVIDFNGASHLR
ncbi:MAG: SDR family oxidoreductase [Acidimicrobiia bacterium]|nr:SDR family oxidoreductase [Acidimicrobiia bacterium]